jgi:hypothetical protein
MGSVRRRARASKTEVTVTRLQEVHSDQRGLEGIRMGAGRHASDGQTKQDQPAFYGDNLVWTIGILTPLSASIVVRATAPTTAILLVALLFFLLRTLLPGVLVFCNRLLTLLMLIRRALLGGCLLLGMLLLLLLAM